MQNQFYTPSAEASNAAQVSPSQSAATRPKIAAHVRLNHNWLAHYLPIIGASALAVYTVLLKRQGKNASAFPSHATIAADAGLSVATVKRALKRLREHKLLDWSNCTERTPRGKYRQTSNDYVLAQKERLNKVTERSELKFNNTRRVKMLLMSFRFHRMSPTFRPKHLPSNRR